MILQQHVIVGVGVGVGVIGQCIYVNKKRSAGIAPVGPTAGICWLRGVC